VVHLKECDLLQLGVGYYEKDICGMGEEKKNPGSEVHEREDYDINAY